MSKTKSIKLKSNVDDVLDRFRATIEGSCVEQKAIELLDEIDKASNKNKINIQEKNSKVIDQFLKLHEFDKHLLLAESLPEEYRVLSLGMADSMIKENNCTTSMEKSLVEVIVNAFCRTLHISSLMTFELTKDKIPLSQNFIGYYNFLSKELDKANRQYLTAITTLQQLKSPPLKVNLKAETAIVGQNQQLNSITKESNEKDKAN